MMKEILYVLLSPGLPRTILEGIIIVGLNTIVLYFYFAKRNKRIKEEPAQKKDPVKITNSEADFQRWKAERQNQEP